MVADLGLDLDLQAAHRLDRGLDLGVALDERRLLGTEPATVDELVTEQSVRSSEGMVEA
jgi:hypothetical protein